ncbi:MAG: ATP-binding cassette domain-containing protein [Actinobacteria bacterium]|nr:ATP-binding cassette domain-containing protein [Actinomycetota bacterium]
MTLRVSRSPVYVLGGLLLLYLLVPIVAFVWRFADAKDRGFSNDGLWDALRTSALSATVAAAVIALLGVPLGYWLAHARGPAAAIVGVVVQLPLALPPVMSGIVLIYLVGPYTTLGHWFGGHLTDSVTGIVLAQTFVAAPFLVIAARAAFEAVDPALGELAAALGHRPISRFWRISLPVASPTIRAGVVMSWLRALGEYGATVLLAYHPYSLPVFTYVQFSSTGIPGTQAPTALALLIASVGVLLSVALARRPRRRRHDARLPEARPPGPMTPTTVDCALDAHVGSFRLQLSHRFTQHRVAILGPSGSGKSITLRSLVGLLGPDAGTVEYNGEPINHVPTERRHIGYVPQGDSLLPGRTVWEQLLFGVDADPALAAWWLHTLHLDGLQNRLPNQLSGGQRQRVRLAQALARSPRLVFLDEPFTALDTPVRDELRRELRRLQQQTGLSTVLVTHDPEEAALLADEILVVAEGRLLQVGHREEVYRRPASALVARLLGIQNLNEGVIAGPGLISAGPITFGAPTEALAPSTDVLWCVRPEHVVLNPEGAHEVVVDDVADVGSYTAVSVRVVGGPELRLRTIERLSLRPGRRARVDIVASTVTVWAAADQTERELEPVHPLPGEAQM